MENHVIKIIVYADGTVMAKRAFTQEYLGQANLGLHTKPEQIDDLLGGAVRGAVMDSYGVLIGRRHPGRS